MANWKVENGSRRWGLAERKWRRMGRVNRGSRGQMDGRQQDTGSRMAVSGRGVQIAEEKE